jgi:hypothetical protein
MMQKIVKKSGPGLQRIVVVEADMTVNRSPRRQIAGIAYNAQKTRLALDEPDASGHESYPCKIADVSDDGFGVVCPAANTVSDLFALGAQMTLETSDGKRSRVEIRWIRNGRLGLRLLTAKDP